MVAEEDRDGSQRVSEHKKEFIDAPLLALKVEGAVCKGRERPSGDSWRGNRKLGPTTRRNWTLSRASSEELGWLTT